MDQAWSNILAVKWKNLSYCGQNWSRFGRKWYCWCLLLYVGCIKLLHHLAVMK